MVKKDRTPIKALPEPQTKAEIEAMIERLEGVVNAELMEPIADRIAILKERLRKLNDQRR
jgi:hypothetical protein